MNITTVSTAPLPDFLTDVFAELFKRRGIAIDGEKTYPRIEALDRDGVPRKIDLYNLATHVAKEIC